MSQRRIKRNNRHSLLRLYERFDAEVTAHIEKSGEKPDCERGCAACCHLSVSATFAEAQEIARVHPEEPPGVVTQAHIAARPGMNCGTWLSLQIPCVFLVGNECSVYRHRPLTCRKHNSVSRKACETPNSLIPHVAISAAPTHKACIEAAFAHGLPAGIGPLPVMLMVAYHQRARGNKSAMDLARQWSVDTPAASARWMDLA